MAMDLKEFEKELTRELNSIRLLIFIEAEPLSNKYFQVILNPDQFLKVSDALPYNHAKQTLLVSNEEYVLPDLRAIDK